MSESNMLNEFDEQQNERLYERLNAVISSTNLSNKALSRILGISEDVVTAWKNKVRYPKSKYLGNIARACNVSVEYLVCRTDNPQRITKTQIRNKFLGREERPYCKNNKIDLALFNEEQKDMIIKFCDKLKRNSEII